MAHDNLLGGAPETRLPTDPAADDPEGADPDATARAHPASSLPWARLAERALDNGRDVEAYAFARTGYHRGLDALRRNGWRGHGPIPWDHEPNRGFLRALAALARASDRIGDAEESDRCRQFLSDSTAEGYAALFGD